MDKPAERLTREKQFRVPVPIGAILTNTIVSKFAETKSKRLHLC